MKTEATKLKEIGLACVTSILALTVISAILHFSPPRYYNRFGGLTSANEIVFVIVIAISTWVIAIASSILLGSVIGEEVITQLFGGVILMVVLIPVLIFGSHIVTDLFFNILYGMDAGGRYHNMASIAIISAIFTTFPLGIFTYHNVGRMVDNTDRKYGSS